MGQRNIARAFFFLQVKCSTLMNQANKWSRLEVNYILAAGSGKKQHNVSVDCWGEASISKIIPSKNNKFNGNIPPSYVDMWLTKYFAKDRKIKIIAQNKKHWSIVQLLSCTILKRNSLLVKCLNRNPTDKSTTLNSVIQELVFTRHRRLGFFHSTWRRRRLLVELCADPRSLVKPPHQPRRYADGSDSGRCLREDDLCDGDEDWQRGNQVVQKRPFHATQLPGSQS